MYDFALGVRGVGVRAPADPVRLLATLACPEAILSVFPNKVYLCLARFSLVGSMAASQTRTLTL